MTACVLIIGGAMLAESVVTASITKCSSTATRSPTPANRGRSPRVPSKMSSDAHHGAPFFRVRP